MQLNYAQYFTFMTLENGKPVLVHWYYSPLEWQLFLKKHGVVKYYVHRIIRKLKITQTPQTIITDCNVTVNGKRTVFHGDGKFLRKVEINEKNDMNVLEIVYERNTAKGIIFKELRIPIPKGKLREAIGLLESLKPRNDLFTLFG